jgi:hypothetical protein
MRAVVMLLVMAAGCGGVVRVDADGSAEPGAGGAAASSTVAATSSTAAASTGEGGGGGAADVCDAVDWGPGVSCCSEPSTDVCAAFYVHSPDCAVALCGSECVLFQPADWGCWTGIGNCHAEPYPGTEPHDDLIVCDL